jgi:pectate lyase
VLFRVFRGKIKNLLDSTYFLIRRKKLKTGKPFLFACIFLSVLCLLAFACKSSTDNNQPEEKPIPVEEITINGGDLTLKTGTTATLTVTVIPESASNKTVTWKSNKTNIVTVDADTGLITAQAVGSTVITAIAKDNPGVFSLGIKVTVTDAPILVESIIINRGNNVILTAGQSRKLGVNVLPATAGNKNVTWSSGAPQIAEVNQSGEIKALSGGTAVITAAAQDGSGKSGMVNVTVTVEEPGDYMTPQEIFASLKGQKVTTNGWADQANSGAGLSYANPASLTFIDDAAYPNPVNKRKAFTDAVNSDNAKFIIVSGDIDLGDGVISDADKSYFDAFDPTTHKRLHGDIRFDIRSNTTIIGINNARLMFGGLNVNNRNNVIIRNVTFYDAHGSTEEDTAINIDSKASIDALTVQGTSDGVWVDHCKFTDGTCNDMIRNFNHDGAFDIPKGKNITVSWCEFTNHDKVMLVAGSDSDANAVAIDRQITLHHNYFHGTTQRMPRTRGTQMHVYNNFYNDIGIAGNTGSFMGPGWGAEFIVENNYFGPKSGKTIEWFDTSAAYPVKFYYDGNNITNTDVSWWGRASNPKPWTPAYSYSPEPSGGLPSSIPNDAGATLRFKK